MQKEILITELKSLCGKVDRLAGNNWQFFYDGYHILYIPSEEDGLLRFCIPHITNVKDYDYPLLHEVINQVNREVKYVKIFIRKNKSVSLEYDYKTEQLKDYTALVSHIINTLVLAANHFIKVLVSSVH